VTSPVADVVRRFVDVLVSGVGLLICAPLLGLVAIIVRLESPGGSFFTQERVGRFGAPFRIHKFRSMRASTSSGLDITAANDRRMTRVGRHLRQWKIDELPQLWDVLRGRMSLVGPRPEVARYVALYPRELAEVVLSVRPGITDPVSLLLRDEQGLLASVPDPDRFYSTVLLPVKLRVSARYLGRRSLGSDLLVILHTVLAIIGVRPTTTPWGDASEFPTPASFPLRSL
jgi:lipopolysaccharide/colanic/teichoic acid biosynthesis glycosyltransferase